MIVWLWEVGVRNTRNQIIIIIVHEVSMYVCTETHTPSL